MSKIIKSSVYLRNLYLKKIPDIFQGVEVRGDFWCYCNQLTSLKGAPEHVGGDFYCFNNQLTSLKYAPKHIGGGFYCRNNHLSSLEGAPKYVGGSFYCYNNAVKFTEEQVRAVCQVKGKVYV